MEKRDRGFRGGYHQDPILDSEFLFGWYSIAQELGCSERTVRRWCDRAGVRLRKWGYGPTTAVMLSKQHVTLLRAQLLRSKVGNL